MRANVLKATRIRHLIVQMQDILSAQNQLPPGWILVCPILVSKGVRITFGRERNSFGVKITFHGEDLGAEQIIEMNNGCICCTATCQRYLPPFCWFSYIDTHTHKHPVIKPFGVDGKDPPERGALRLRLQSFKPDCLGLCFCNIASLLQALLHAFLPVVRFFFSPHRASNG